MTRKIHWTTLCFFGPSLHVVDEWLELSIENDKGKQFAICSLSFAFLDFAFFKQSFFAAFLCVRAEKKVSYLFIFVIREN